MSYGLRIATATLLSAVPVTSFAAGGSLHVDVEPAPAYTMQAPAGAMGVIVLSLNLSKDCGTSVVPPRRITLVDNGTGSVTDIESVYGVIEGARITKQYWIDPQSRTATINFPATFSFQDCSPIQLDVVVNLSKTAKGSSHSFSVEFPTDLWTDGIPVVGEFPLKGMSFNIAASVDYCSSAEIAKLSPRGKASQRSHCRRMRALEMRKRK